MRERDRRLERVADDVGEESIALEPRAELRHALRMDEKQRVQLFGFLPERIESRRGQLFAVHDGAERCAAHAVDLERLRELFSRELGVLNGNGRKRDEAIGTVSSELRELAVLNRNE